MTIGTKTKRSQLRAKCNGTCYYCGLPMMRSPKHNPGAKNDWLAKHGFEPGQIGAKAFLRHSRETIEHLTKSTVIDDDIDLKGMKKDTLLKFTEELLQMVKTTVIDHDRPTRSDLHPTMKPIKLVREHIEASSRPDEIVLDFFGGAGSTLIAAETCGRRARLMELDPNYADVIIKRWEEFVGEQAELIDG